jgi:SAM-dependent methyltransferase
MKEVVMDIVGWLKPKVIHISRQKKLDHFYSLAKNGKILDAGVSDAVRVAGENMFLETFRFPDNCYTGLGVEDLSAVQALHPGKKLVTYSGDYFPFEDKEFDWVFSNAVIEHVGDDAAQLRFVNEMLRVSKNVFFTTPNKFFPVESHTNALFLHWLPGNIFYDWCAKNSPYWNRKNLYLFGRSRLDSLMKQSSAKHYEIVSNRLFGWPMTYTIICSS